MKIQIEPIVVGLRETANFIELFQEGYALGSNIGCKVKVQYFNGNDLKVEERIEIPAKLIADWTDDQTLIDYVIETLELVVVEQEEFKI